MYTYIKIKDISGQLAMAKEKFSLRYREICLHTWMFMRQSRAFPKIEHLLDRCWAPVRWNQMLAVGCNKIRKVNDHWLIIYNIGKNLKSCRPLINPIVYSNKELINRINNIESTPNATLQQKSAVYFETSYKSTSSSSIQYLRMRSIGSSPKPIHRNRFVY